jgi:hypothetical protein
MEAKVEQFIKELKELCDKHEIYLIDKSCGCCGHSALVNKTDKVLMEYQAWISDQGNYVFAKKEHI